MIKKPDNSTRAVPLRTWRIALATLAVFLFADHAISLIVAAIFGLQGNVLGAEVNVLQVGIAFLAVGLVLRMGPRRAAAELGLVAPLGRAWLIAFVATLPMPLAFAATGGLGTI